MTKPISEGDGSGGEMKPCPFCGEKLSTIEGWIHCNNSGCMAEAISPDSIEEWNNAYCWKEIDRLTAELSVYKAQFDSESKKDETLVKENVFLIKENAKLLHENAVLKNALDDDCLNHSEEIERLMREREELISALEHDKSCAVCGDSDCSNCDECKSEELLARIKGEVK